MRNEYSANQALAASAKENLEQDNRYVDFDEYMANLDMDRQAKISAQSADLIEQIEYEMADSNNALLNILMQTLGMIVVATIAYWAFIQFIGA